MSAKTAKKHWHDRPDSERDLTLRTWCREIHVHCAECQTYLGRTYNPATDRYE